MVSENKMITVSIKDAKKIIGMVMDKNKTAYLEGDPGIGKSRIVHDVARAKNRKLTDVRAILFDVGDLVMKVPNRDRTKLVEIVTDILPSEPGTILFFDEFRQAPPEVRRMFYQLILDKRLGSTYILPKDTCIIAASNKSEDVDTDELEGPLFDRWEVRMCLATDLKEWVSWASEIEGSAPVVGYLNYFKEDFLDRDKETDIVLSTPRRWEMVIMNPELAEYILPPGIGKKYTEFQAKVAMFKDVSNYVDGSKEWPKDIGDQFAVMTAILADCDSKDYEKKINNVLELKMKGANDEIKALLVFSVLRYYKVKKKAKSLFELMNKVKDEKKIDEVLHKYQYIVAD
jgi:hypothetical protein